LVIGADNSASQRLTAVFFTNYSSGFISIQFTDLATGLRVSRIWRTTDGGLNWTNSIDLPVQSIVHSIHGDLNADKLILVTEGDGVWETDYALQGE